MTDRHRHRDDRHRDRLTVPTLGGTSPFPPPPAALADRLVFGGYLVVHLLVNATIAQGGNVYQTQVDKIHYLPFLPVIEWTFIYLPILFHTVYGIWITLTGQPNSATTRTRRTGSTSLQRISAIVIVFFMLFHVLALKYGLFGTSLASTRTARRCAPSRRHMDAAWWITWVVYPLGILASCYHLANGFWTAAITWGLTISAAPSGAGATCAPGCSC